MIICIYIIYILNILAININTYHSKWPHLTFIKTQNREEAEEKKSEKYFRKIYLTNFSIPANLSTILLTCGLNILKEPENPPTTILSLGGSSLLMFAMTKHPASHSSSSPPSVCTTVDHQSLALNNDISGERNSYNEMSLSYIFQANLSTGEKLLSISSFL